MKATREEQLSPQPAGKRFPVVELLLALAVIGALVLFWRYWQDGPEPGTAPIDVPPISDASTPTEAILPPTPDIPRRSAPTPGTNPETAEPETATAIAEAARQAPEPPEPPPQLSPEEGIALLRRELTQMGGTPALEKLAASERPMDTTAALIDGLGNGLILRKMVPTTPPAPGFKVQRAGDLFYMDEANYGRYDALATRVSGLDTVRMVDGFHTLRPLFEKAYDTLGLDPGEFDNAIVRTLDLVLATPEINEPIALKPKSVIYLYADPALESLPGVQKQLLRMGPNNIRLIKQQAKALRALLLAP